MSENKRNKKFMQNKEPKRTLLLAKKEDKEDNKLVEKPKILLKTKEKDITVQSNPSPIIVARPPTSTESNNIGNNESKQSKAVSAITTATASKEVKDSNLVAAVHETSKPKEMKLSVMKKPAPIISDHYQINSDYCQYLIETNADFFVVGVVGTQGSGKSSILNILIDDEVNAANESNDAKRFKEILSGQAGIFRTRSNTKESAFSTLPSTEGIQIYVTQDRTILLDCSPVLCNPYKKDGILNELDDLKMLIFLLSVCHLLIVVDDSNTNGLNMHLMRLLQMAENMKIDSFEKDASNMDRTANIMLLKNKCQNLHYSPESQQRTNKLYKMIFRDSKLNTYMKSSMYVSEFNSKKDEDLNIVYFPLIDKEKNNQYVLHPNLNLLIAEFRQRVFMSLRTPFPTANQQQSAFTEKNWSQLANFVWESHRNNYFLRKFETFKEKEWALRIP